MCPTGSWSTSPVNARKVHPAYQSRSLRVVAGSTQVLRPRRRPAQALRAAPPDRGGAAVACAVNHYLPEADMNAIDAVARATLSNRKKAIYRLFRTNTEDEKRLQDDRPIDWPDRALAEETASLLGRLS